MKKKEYSILLQKGLAMFNETITLLDLWKPGLSTNELTEIALQNDSLGRSTENRIKDIVYRIFFRRYIVENDQPAKNLKQLLKNGFDQIKLQQIMMLYICRSDEALSDFIKEVYWARFYTGMENISKEDALNFLYDAKYNGYMKGSWSEQQVNRIGANLLGILEEFRMVTPHKRGVRTILPFHPYESTILYIMHELHFTNFSDTSILENPIWSLFGLQPYEIFQEFERISYSGHFIIQGTYDFIKINWQYKTMEDFLNGIS